MTTRWTRKDLLGLRELSADEINFILETADAFKQVGTREIKKVPALRGKTLVNFFVEPSTRTNTRRKRFWICIRSANGEEKSQSYAWRSSATFCSVAWHARIFSVCLNLAHA